MWMREFDRRQIEKEASRAGLEVLHWQEYEEEDEPIGVVLAPVAGEAQ
jgi:hypothetical protein